MKTFSFVRAMKYAQELSCAPVSWLLNRGHRTSRKLKQNKVADVKYKKIFDLAMDSFVIFDKEGNLLDVNAHAEKMFERQHGQLIKLSGKDIVHPDSYTFFERFMREAFSRGHSKCEVLNVRQDGSTFYSDLRGTLFEHGGRLHLFAIFREITELKRMEKWNRYLMAHDPLTGLYNRAYFEEEISKLERGRVFPVSIIMIDVDGMKLINDTKGHRAGDELLRRAARVLRMSFRSEDVAARIGGDEFAVLLPGADSGRAKEALSRLHHSIANYKSKQHEPRLSLSVGSATGYQGAHLSKVLEEADMNMYRDKLSRTRDPDSRVTRLPQGAPPQAEESSDAP